MRLRGRPEDHDELVPVARLDDPEGPSSTRVVELAPRRRGRELALIAVAVAVVIGVGLVDDGGGGGDVSAEPTTTSTRKPSTTREKTSTTRRRATTASTSRPPTTTTTWPQHQAGTGPLLPGPPSGIHVAVLEGDGLVSMIDVDTGDRCRTKPASGGGWMLWNMPTAAERLVVQTNGGAVAVDRDCAINELGLEVNFHNGYPAAVSFDRLWMASGDSSEHLTEYGLPRGQATGRTVELPRFGGANVVIVGDHLVLGMMGEMTLLDPSTDERQQLGPGTPLAAHESLVAFIACPEMRCRLGLADLGTGERRVVDDLEPIAWDPATFSPDGRLLRVPVAGSHRDQPASAVVDIESGTVRIIDEQLQSAQFSPDNRWLIGIANGRIVAHHLEDPELNVVLAPELSQIQGFGLL